MPRRIRHYIASLAVVGALLVILQTVSFALEVGEMQLKRDPAIIGMDEMFPPPVFSHNTHRIRFRCDACHNDIFEMKLGSTKMSMELIAKGEVCGTCHNGEIAFSADGGDCSVCHKQVP